MSSAMAQRYAGPPTLPAGPGATAGPPIRPERQHVHDRLQHCDCVSEVTAIRSLRGPLAAATGLTTGPPHRPVPLGAGLQHPAMAGRSAPDAVARIARTGRRELPYV